MQTACTRQRGNDLHAGADWRLDQDRDRPRRREDVGEDGGMRVVRRCDDQRVDRVAGEQFAVIREDHRISGEETPRLGQGLCARSRVRIDDRGQ